MENNDQARKFNELGRWLAGHDEELDALNEKLKKSNDENLKISNKYVDLKIERLVNSLSFTLVMFLRFQTNPNFNKLFNDELEELSTQARGKGISLKDHISELKKNGTLPKHLKEIVEDSHKMAKTF